MNQVHHMASYMLLSYVRSDKALDSLITARGIRGPGPGTAGLHVLIGVSVFDKLGFSMRCNAAC